MRKKKEFGQENPFNCILEPSTTQMYPLYLGDVNSLQQNQIIANVNTVICCIKGYLIHKKISKQHNCNIVAFQIRDKIDQNIYPYFELAYNQIENGFKVGGVLVHCFAGISRSASIVISYLMRKRKMTLEQAHKFVIQRRTCIQPNSGFMEQLKKYEEQLRTIGIYSQKQNKQLRKRPGSAPHKILKPKVSENRSISRNEFLINEKAKLLYAISTLKKTYW